MKLKLVVTLYLGFWVGIAAVLAYFGVGIGVPVWATAVSISVVFFIVNGSLAYVYRSRQLKREGQMPPGYVNYLFQTQKISDPIQVPATVRVALSLIVAFGAALFVFAGGVLILGAKNSSQLLAGCILLALGLAFAYVAYRVIRMSRSGRRLFGADRDLGAPNHSLQPTPNDGAAERPR
jgi:hypothetical protein